MRASRVLVVLAAVVAAAAPAAVVAWLLSRDLGPVLESQEPPAAIIVPVDEGTTDRPQPVTVRIARSPGMAVRATSLTGTIVTSNLTPGTSVGNAAELAVIDQQRVFSIVGDVPLYRPLALGDEGADVAVLWRFLVDYGVLDASVAEPATRVDVEMAEAISAFNEDIGLKRVRRNSAGRIVSAEADHQRFVWIGPEEIEIGSAAVEQGMAWPGAGQELFSAPEEIASVTFVSAVEGSESEVVADGSQDLVVADSTYALTGEGSLSATGLEELALAFPREAEVPGRLHLRDPQVGLLVPASAVFTDAGGEGCVATAPDRVVTVAVLSSEFGSALVESSEPFSEVVANPSQLPGSLTCS